MWRIFRVLKGNFLWFCFVFAQTLALCFRDVNDVTKACFEIDAMETAQKYNSAWKRTNG